MNEWSFPASYAQERVWLANQLDPGSPVYNVSTSWRCAGLSQAQITEALAAVVERHESLRTHLRMDDGTLTQVVRAAEPIDLPVRDLRPVTEAEVKARVSVIAEELARTAIPLDAPPLWRALLVRLGESDWGLLFVAHHAIFDARSHVVFHQELGELLRAAATGTTADLPQLPIQYADFAAWQREQLSGPELDRQLDFWRERLSGAPAVIALPTDNPRPPELSFAGGEVHFDFPAVLLDDVGRLARSGSATPYMVLLSAFAAMLARLSGGEDIVIGVSTAGRDRPELSRLIGMFVNPIALRCDLTGDPTFVELLGRVRGSLLDAMEHGETPFQRVVDALAPQRSQSVQPIFQVAFNFIPESGLDSVTLGTTKDDLAFDIAPGTSRLLYRTALFDRSTGETIIARYLRLLTSALADPGRRVSELALLDDAERELVVRTWNDTDLLVVPAGSHHGPADGLATWPVGTTDAATTTVTALIEAQVARTPDATALVCGHVTLTYAQLNTRANRLARRLVADGAGPESLVALVLPRSADLLVATLAVLKSGAAYLPVDTGYPAERIAYLLRDAAPAVALTVTETAGLIAPGSPVKVWVLDSDEGDAVDGTDHADVTDAERSSPLRGEHPAYVIYTSGSTGQPKGVVVEHRTAHTYLTWARETYPGLRGAALLHSPMSFDLTVTGLLGPLITGGTVRLAAIDEAPARAGGRPDFVKATPGHLPLLDAELSPTGDLVLGGEALTSEPLRIWRTANPQATVINEYGPTETTVGCIAALIPPGAQLPDGPVTIGRPIRGTRAYLLDAHLRPVPPGVTGELYLAGAQLARGYLRRPGLTAERFLPCPFDEPGQRMYRTGDLARWRADGTIDYLGRGDQQVKIRGMRVELGEITSTILTLPGIRDAAVLADEQAPGDTRLIAYVVGDTAGTDLGSDLARLLPAHLVPAAFVTLDALPLTPNGKLDRGALPEPAAAPLAYAAPETDAQRLVAEVFADILGVDRVGSLDNFFTLGGNSLSGMRAMARIRAQVDVDLPMRALFGQPVVADLAAEIERLVAAELDGLTDDEVAALLATDGRGPR